MHQRVEPVAARMILLLALVSSLLLGCASQNPTPEATAVQGPPASHEELARHYAPEIHHGVASDQDFITAVDFDGDWVSNNNWENQPGGDLSAHVYYSVIETGTHWFLFYSLFHPRDYTDDPCEDSGGCHENDMESIQLVVRKDGSSFGQLQAVETLAHGDINLFPAGDGVRGNFLMPRSKAKLEGSHPIVYVETYGHGIYAQRKILVPNRMVYRAGDQARVPQDMADKDVAYALVPIYDTLWQHRDEIGPGKAFDTPFDYRGQTLPAAFDGENYGKDRANPPWGYDQAIGDTLQRGDWFLDPARALLYHAEFEGEFSTEYLYNPYLDDLGLGTTE